MSLVAWYPLNGDINDYSGNNYSLVSGTATVDQNGKIGQTYLFDSAADYAYVPSTTFDFSNSFKGDFSISFWYKLIALSATNRGIISCGTAGSDTQLHIVVRSTGNMAFAFYADDYNSTYTVPEGVWVHYTMVGDSKNKKQKMYINGTYYGERTTTSWLNIPSGNNFLIGNYSGLFPNGYLNDIRIYNHALSEKEIKEIAKAKILHYTFDDFQEPTTNLIMSPNTNNTTSIGIPAEAFKAGITGYSTYSSGYGVQQFTTVSTPGTNTFTFSVWLRSPSETKSTYLLYVWTGVGGDSGWQSFGSGTLTSDWQRISSTRTLTDGTVTKVLIYRYNQLGTLDICAPQLEVKPYVSSFVIGSRSGVVNDSSGFRNNAVLAAATTPQWVSNSKTGSGSYKFKGYDNSVYTASGTNISCSDSGAFNFGSEDFTIAYWAYKTADGYAGGNSYFRKGFYDTGIDMYDNLLRVNTSTGTLATVSCVAASDSWNHYAYVITQKSTPYIKRYVNGVLDNSTYTETGNLGVITMNSEPLVIGWSNAGGANRYFNGNLDDYRIYRTALSQEEILELYQTRASLDKNGNLHVPEVYENLWNRCPPFEKWTLSNGATVTDGVLTIPNQSAYATSPFMYIGPDAGWWSFRAEFFSTGVSSSFTPDAGYLMSSKYYSAAFKSTQNTANYTGNGNAAGYPVNLWTTKTWTYLGGNLVHYVTIAISGNPTWTPVEGFMVRRPMLTTSAYTGPFSEYSDRLLPNTESILSSLEKEGVYRSNTLSEMGITDGLIAYFPLDGNAKDLSGRQKDGTVNGPVVTSGIQGLAYDFDGINDYISFPQVMTTADIRTSGVTYAAWVKMDTVAQARILGQSISSGYSDFASGGIGVSAAGKALAICYDDSGAYRNVTGSTTLVAGTWYHIAMTYTAQDKYMRLYVNGVKEGTDSLITTFSRLFTNASNRIGINDNVTQYPLDGVIDEARIYSRPLTAAEISILYEATDPTTAGMKVTKESIYLKGEIKEVN